MAGMADKSKGVVSVMIYERADLHSLLLNVFVLHILLNSVICSAKPILFKETSPIFGVVMQEYILNNPHGVSRAFVVRVNRSTGNFKLKLITGKSLLKREKLSLMARRENAVTAINGSFFSWNGMPLSMMSAYGRIIKQPIYTRTCIGIDRLGNVLIGRPNYRAELSSAAGILKISAVNQPAKYGQIVAYTREYGFNTGNANNGIELTILRNRVVAIRNQNSLIPPGGFVVYGSGEKQIALEKLELGDKVDLNIGLDGRWSSVDCILGAGPRLVSEGSIFITAEEENFKADIADSIAPRSAFAVTETGDYLLVAADGRQKEYSVGLSLQELAEFLVFLKAKDALNLDGGGSTALFANGVILNSPSGGEERKVSNALMILESSDCRGFR